MRQFRFLSLCLDFSLCDSVFAQVKHIEEELASIIGYNSATKWLGCAIT